jgi:MFS family permease
VRDVSPFSVFGDGYREVMGQGMTAIERVAHRARREWEAVKPAYDDRGVVRRSQIVDIMRAVPLGVMLPLETSVLLTIAIKEFDAAWWVKWLVAAANGVGLLAAPFVTSIARRWGRPVMVPAAYLAAMGGLGLLAASVGWLSLYVVGAIVGIATLNAVFPLTTVTYERNFPPRELGTRVGWGMSLKVLVSAAAGLAMGWFLTRWPDRWWVVLVVAGVAMFVLALLNLQMPSARLDSVDGVANNAWPHFHLLLEDRRLMLTLSAWMLMGFGNLMLLPLRVEYLAQPQYGIAATAGEIVVLTVVIPSAVRLVAMPLFGVVFDRMSFFAARILVNMLFALYVAAFFAGTTWVGLVVGAVMLGIGSAGGDLMWSLWVTKFAPAGRTADYMGLHTFFTGIRAFLAPMVGFAIVGTFSLTAIAAGAAVLMVISSLVLVPEARAERASRQAREAASVTAGR